MIYVIMAYNCKYTVIHAHVCKSKFFCGPPSFCLFSLCLSIWYIWSILHRNDENNIYIFFRIWLKSTADWSNIPFQIMIQVWFHTSVLYMPVPYAIKEEEIAWWRMLKLVEEWLGDERFVWGESPSAPDWTFPRIWL